MITRRMASAVGSSLGEDNASGPGEDRRQQELQSFGETECLASVTEGASGALGAPQDPSRPDPEVMAVRRLELELEKVRLQLECERVALRRAELEHSSRRSSVSESDERRHNGIDEVAQCAKMLKAYRLPCDADVPMWFDEVEKLFSSFQVPEGNRVHLIMPVLSERVRYLLCSLSEEECADYETVKRAVLNELQLTPAEYLERLVRGLRITARDVFVGAHRDSSSEVTTQGVTVR
ncbi:hypothetical protein MTO96_022638 [Rhipicephalus appendiculatus]